MPIATASDEPPDDGDPLIGAVVGDTLIVRLIGIDGPSRVYEGHQQRKGRTVVVRLMRSGLPASRDMARVDRSRNVVPRFSHPGIVQVYASGVHMVGDEPLPYCIMEFVTGSRTLFRYADDLELDKRARVRLFRNVCDAVAYLHERHVVHRDLQPANILVDATGIPKVTGYAPANLTGLQNPPTGTEADLAICTHRYLSPEQILGDPGGIDQRCDVYALGVVLHELLTRRTPHEHSGKMIIDVRRLAEEDEPAAPSAVDASAHNDLVAIIDTCLQRDRDRRYRCAGALRDDLSRYLAGEPILASGHHSVNRVRSALQRATEPAVRAVCLLLGLSALCFSALAAFGLAGAIRRQSWQESRFFGGLTVLGTGGAVLALRRAFRWDSVSKRSLRLGRRDLTHSEAIALAQHEGWPLIRVSGHLTSLTVDMARQLVDVQSGAELDLHNVTSVTPAVMKVLATCRGALNLSGLVELTPECARHLVRFHRPLDLDGLRAISDATAEALGQHVGWLFLNGLKRLSPTAARCLASHQPVVHLGELYNWVSLNGLDSLSDEAAWALGGVPGDLSLDGIDSLSPMALQGIARHKVGILSLRGLWSLSDEAAALFSDRTNIVDLSGLREVSPEAFASLRNNPCILLPRLGFDSAGSGNSNVVP